MTAPPLRARLNVLGVPVDFVTNAQAVLSALAAVLDADGAAGPREIGTPNPQRLPSVRLWLTDAAVGSAGPISFRESAPHLLEIEGPGFQAQADAQALTASCTLTLAALESNERFQDTILATLTLFLVTRLDRQPFHAAALIRQGRAVLLTGPSGAGKSTLAYAALRRGWSALTDDAVYLQSQPITRIWTRPTRLHLSADAARWFDELANQRPVLRENAKWKLAIESLPPAHTAPPLEHALLCLLQPSVGEPVSRQLAVDVAMAALLQDMEPGFAIFRDTIDPVLRTLLRTDGAWLVRTGSDPRLTILALEQLLDARTNE